MDPWNMNAAEAEKGLAVLTTSPAGHALLAQRIRPVEQTDPDRLQRLLADLDDLAGDANDLRERLHTVTEQRSA